MALAVITGAGRGIGRATAIACGKRGLDVAILSREEHGALRVADEVRALGVRAIAIACDVSEAAQVERARDLCLRAGDAPQVLVNNAGIVRRASVESMSEADWDAVLDVNLKGTFLVTRAFLPAMRARGSGRIVNVASISATLGTANQSAYCAAKWGVVGFTKALAEELRGSGLQAVSILPGSVDTDMLKGSPFAPQMSADDVARMIVHLALDAPAAVQGSAVEMFGP